MSLLFITNRCLIYIPVYLRSYKNFGVKGISRGKLEEALLWNILNLFPPNVLLL